MQAHDLTDQQRVRMFVGGNFSAAALGPLFDDVLHAIDADPLGHLRAFEQLYLTARPSRLALTDFHLDSFLQRIARTHPREVRATAATLARLVDSLARAQANEAAEASDSAQARELARQSRQLRGQRDGLARLLAG